MTRALAWTTSGERPGTAACSADADYKYQEARNEQSLERSLLSPAYGPCPDAWRTGVDIDRELCRRRLSEPAGHHHRAIRGGWFRRRICTHRRATTQRSIE